MATLQIWQELLINTIQLKAQESKTNAFNRLSPFKRLLLTVSGKRPHKPRKGAINAEGMALRYIQEVNKTYGCGKRKDLENGKSIHLVTRYDAATLLPCVTITYFDGSCAFQERRQFDANGNNTELGCAYPYSEIGVTGLPLNLPDEAETVKLTYKRLLQAISETIRQTKTDN